MYGGISRTLIFFSPDAADIYWVGLKKWLVSHRLQIGWFFSTYTVLKKKTSPSALQNVGQTKILTCIKSFMLIYR